MENQKKAETYYTMVGSKDKEGFQKFLHPDVEFKGPLATLKGKEAVVRATGHFMDSITSLKIRSKFQSGNQTMMVYDTVIPGISDNFPGASLMTFDKEGMIVKIELFYDSAPMQEKKEEIFS